MGKTSLAILAVLAAWPASAAAPSPTWRPPPPGPIARADLPDSAFAFPAERKEPLTDAAHVRSAIARFFQVKGVTDQERDLAFANIRAAAAAFAVPLGPRDWRERRPK